MLATAANVGVAIIIIIIITLFASSYAGLFHFRIQDVHGKERTDRDATPAYTKVTTRRD